MKFSTKLTLSSILLLALCAGVLSSILLQQSFDTMLTVACEQYARTQMGICHTLAGALDGLEPDADIARRSHALQAAAQELGQRTGLVASMLYIRQDDGTPLYKSLPDEITEQDAIAALDGDPQQHAIYQSGDILYAGFCAPFWVNGQGYQVFTLCDVTAVFRFHTAQRQKAALLTAGLVAVGALVVWVICTLVTRPIRRLDAAAAAIAGGDYAKRSGAKGGDEIASLGRSFDHMADTVQENIRDLRLHVQRQEQFVSSFTHELKTPMTAMLGYADLLRSQSCDEATTRLAAGYIHSETSRLASLSQSLLMLQGLTREKPQLQPFALDLLVQQLQRSLSELPQGMRLVTDGPVGVWVLIQQDLALVLLRNLVQNALRAQPRDGTVRLSWSRSGSSVAFAVQDTGCGIPAEDLPHITQPFYMVDKSRARANGGSGVGLAICSQIMALHGGELRFESAVGQGTTVRFCLPLAEPPREVTENEA